MKIAVLVVTILIDLTGLVFFLQGIGVLPGSYMTGQAQWALIGLVMLILSGGAQAYLLRHWRE